MERRRATRRQVLALAGWAVAGCGGADPAPAGGGATPGPTIRLTAPPDLASGITGTLTLAAEADGDVQSVDFEVDGIAVARLSAPPYGVGVDTHAYASGQHVVRARSRDAAGKVSAWASATVQFGGSRSQPAGFTRDAGWLVGLADATAFAQAPDGRWFVAEQGGALRVVKGGGLLATPFATLAVDASGERGLIGVAVHPDFAANGFVYVYATRRSAGRVNNRVSRWRADGDVAAAGSELTIADLPPLSSATNHNGGALHFGADGKLYVAVGDNANGARAQDLADPFGKLLRFNDDGTIPADNPFFGTQSGPARAIWAYGLRNPYTFAVQPGSGRIHINDVGQDRWEEINLGAAGSNHGWPGSEGPDNVRAGASAPIFTYKHSAASPAGSGPGGFFTGIAIAGGTFYPASGPFPAPYRGQYFFADFGSRFIARLDTADGNAAYAFGSVGDSPVDMAVGIDGALYVLTRDGITRFGAS